MGDLGLLAGIEARCTAARHPLITGDGNVALVCHRIEDAAFTDSGQVPWRRGGAPAVRRAGMLRETLCPLLDADSLVASVRHG